MEILPKQVPEVFQSLCQNVIYHIEKRGLICIAALVIIFNVFLIDEPAAKLVQGMVCHDDVLSMYLPTWFIELVDRTHSYRLIINLLEPIYSGKLKEVLSELKREALARSQFLIRIISDRIKKYPYLFLKTLAGILYQIKKGWGGPS